MSGHNHKTQFWQVTAGKGHRYGKETVIRHWIRDVFSIHTRGYVQWSRWWNRLVSQSLFVRQSDKCLTTLSGNLCQVGSRRYIHTVRHLWDFDHVNIFALLTFSCKHAWNLGRVRNNALWLRVCLSCKKRFIWLMCCTLNKYSSLHISTSFMSLSFFLSKMPTFL